jgi:hypothetical protein
MRVTLTIIWPVLKISFEELLSGTPNMRTAIEARTRVLEFGGVGTIQRINLKLKL